MNKEHLRDLQDFLGTYLNLQYEMFTYKLIELIQKTLDEGKTWDEIKIEFEYDPSSTGFKMQLASKQEMISLMNESLIDLLEIGDATKYFEIIQGNISLDQKAVKKALKEKDKPKSSLIMLH